MSKQTLWRRLLKRPYVGINIERHARLRVTKTPSELDSQDTLLMPEGGTPVTEQMRVQAGGAAHRVAEGRAFDTTERLQNGDDPGFDRDPAAAIGLAGFWADTDTQPQRVDVSSARRYCFADSHPSVFYEDDRKPITRVKYRQQGKDIVLVGGFWYLTQRLRKSDGLVAGWILRERVKDHTGLPYVPSNSAWPEPVRDHVADPADDVSGAK